MKNLYILALLLSWIGSFSQNKQSPYTPNVHSPEISSLGKFIDYPVNISTGVPKVEIPLYEIKSGSLKLPITLSYHASGIKVNEDASSIGLGWNLNAGGAIIRNVKDVPDEYGIAGFLTTGNSIPVYNDIDNSTNSVGATGNNDLLKSYYGFGNYDPFHKDTSSDIYSIQTNTGLAGEFYVDNNLKFVSADFDPINIDANLQLNKITIKNNEGVSYQFGQSFTNENAYDKVTGNSFFINDAGEQSVLDYLPNTSAWHLTEMVSADHSDTIQIKYKKNGDFPTMALVEKRSYTGSIIGVSKEHRSTVNKTVSSYRIDKIITKEGLVQFDYAFDRQDWGGTVNDPNNPPRLISLTVKTRNGDTIKKIVLDNNDYFNRFASSLLYTQHFNQPIPAHHLKSLKLKGVNFFDKNNTLIDKYGFEYDPTQLPSKNSGSIDFWGYYNGKINNTLLPTTNLTVGFNPDSFSYEKRNTDINFMKAGTLTKVIYPTGGFTEYEYEPNYFLSSKQEQGQELLDKSFSVYALKSAANCYDEINSLITQPQVIKEFTITDTTTGVINFNVYFSDYYATSANAPRVVVKVNGWQKILTHGPTGSNTPYSESFSFPATYGSTVRIEAYINSASEPSMGSPCKSPFISVQGQYQYYGPVTSQTMVPKQAGGLRVKTISSYDNNSSLVLKKSYEYGSKKVGANNIGVGKLLANPYEIENYYISYQLQPMPGSNGCVVQHIETTWLHANPLVEMGKNNGSPVYYDQVTEYTEALNDNTKKLGKTEYLYSSQGVDVLISADYYRRYNTLIFPFWKKNNLTKKNDYKFENNQYLPVYSEEYSYSDLVSNKIRTLNIFEKDTETIEPVCEDGEVIGSGGGNPNRFIYFNDYISIGKRVLDVKTVKQYLYNGITTEPIITTTKYQYNNPQHYQLTKEIQSYPDNKVGETNIVYAHEKNNTKLINANIIGVPLETTVVIKQNAGDSGKIISKNETKYDNPNNLFPSSLITYDIGTSTTVTEVNFDQYDTNGNLVQYTTKDGISTVIIWGYNGTQPIAKIENAKLSDINLSVLNTIVGASDADNAGGTNNDETALFAAFKVFRESLPNYKITTYSYDPLIGVRSITPPSGIKESYFYDSANRLEKVVDANGKVLKEMKYNYKN